jgi:hypothetical protein
LLNLAWDVFALYEVGLADRLVVRPVLDLTFFRAILKNVRLIYTRRG